MGAVALACQASNAQASIYLTDVTTYWANDGCRLHGTDGTTEGFSTGHSYSRLNLGGYASGSYSYLANSSGGQYTQYETAFASAWMDGVITSGDYFGRASLGVVIGANGYPHRTSASIQREWVHNGITYGVDVGTSTNSDYRVASLGLMHGDKVTTSSYVYDETYNDNTSGRGGTQFQIQQAPGFEETEIAGVINRGINEIGRSSNQSFYFSAPEKIITRNLCLVNTNNYLEQFGASHFAETTFTYGSPFKDELVYEQKLLINGVEVATSSKLTTWAKGSTITEQDVSPVESLYTFDTTGYAAGSILDVQLVSSLKWIAYDLDNRSEAGTLLGSRTLGTHNALSRIEVVPEPTSILGLGIGAVGIFMRKIKRK